MSSIAIRALGHAIAGFAAFLLATAALTANAQAASDAAQPAVAAHDGWGAGPIVVTLLDAAGREGPIPGTETGVASNNVAARPVGGSLPIPEKPRLEQTPVEVSVALAALSRQRATSPLIEAAFPFR